MRSFAGQFVTLLVLASVFGPGCSGKRAEHPLSATSTSPSPTPTVADSSTAAELSAIRKVDFANFDYSISKGFRIVLRNGRYEGNPQSDEYPFTISHLAYGDVTRDGSEEAIVVLAESVRGSAIPYTVFIYSMSNGSPKLLWLFETGDRADGGLRQVYAENGELVVELYGKGTSVGGKLYNTEAAACCPRFFSRTRYQWAKGRFIKNGDIEVLDNPATSAAVMMPRFSNPG